ncbi:forkhead box protein Q1-like [Montipora capricornis]|uniref:forkhead box protein Q1-like n=1 Tax=Montipora capricornis TaxID=246305 RepID=UPI0035F1F041
MEEQSHTNKERKDPCLSSKSERLKPPHSYIALIATAILNSPGKKMTLTEINEYLVQHYTFFRGPYQGWKNSVRHNLSFNKCFVKILRDPARPWGKDNFWTVSSLHDYLLADGTFRRRRRRKPKRKDEREVMSHGYIAEQIVPCNMTMRDIGMHEARRNILMLPPSYETVRSHSNAVHVVRSSTKPKPFQGSFSIESILADEKTRAKEECVRRGSESFPVRSVRNTDIGSLPGPRNIVHYCKPTPVERPFHFQKPEQLCTTAKSLPNPTIFTGSAGCAMWNASCHCCHPCATSTHFHACY